MSAMDTLDSFDIAIGVVNNKGIVEEILANPSGTRVDEEKAGNETFGLPLYTTSPVDSHTEQCSFSSQPFPPP